MTVTTSRLKNGLTVVTDAMDTVETASVGVWVGVGTRDEHPRINGASHFLEHMAFKGTKRRSARAIAEEIEAVGGHLNAYTAREQTAYFAKVLKEDLELAVDIVGDILQNATMDPVELDRERTVILQEIHQANDTPDDIVFDHFQAQAFPDQPLGRPVLGTLELVKGMSRDTLLEYMQSKYAAESMVLSAAGRVDHDEVVRLAEKTFADLPSRAATVREPGQYVGGGHREDKNDLEQVHLVLGFEGLEYKDPDFYTASVLSTLFGGGMSSRLFQEARETRGLVYSIYSYMSCYTDGGLFGIYAGTGAEEVTELVPLIADEIAKVRENVDEAEVARARAQLKASILMSLESTSSRCEQRARQHLVFGRSLTTEEVVAEVEAVDAAAVKRVAGRLLSGRPTVAAIGPLDRLEDFDAIAARMG